MDAEEIAELKGLVEYCKQNPSVVHAPSLAFFKHFLQGLGAQIPASGILVKDDVDDQYENQSEKLNASKDDIFNEDIVESDVKLVNSDIVEPENDPLQKMGDPSIKVTKENGEAVWMHQAKSQDSEAASVSKDGEVIGVHSSSELKDRLNTSPITSRLAVIYFTAAWCGPCRYISPEISRIAVELPKVAFLKVDIDKATDAVIEWNVSSIPSFFLVKNGEQVDEVVSTDIGTIEKKISQHAG